MERKKTHWALYIRSTQNHQQRMWIKCSSRLSLFWGLSVGCWVKLRTLMIKRLFCRSTAVMTRFRCMRRVRETQAWWRGSSWRGPGIKIRLLGSSTARRIVRLGRVSWLGPGDSRLYVPIDIPTNICRESLSHSHSPMWTMSLPNSRNVHFSLFTIIEYTFSRLQVGFSRKIYGWSTQARWQKWRWLCLLQRTCNRPKRVIPYFNFSC